jgi:hypothetical protein
MNEELEEYRRGLYLELRAIQRALRLGQIDTVERDLAALIAHLEPRGNSKLRSI